jgi:hypothetical protein
MTVVFLSVIMLLLFVGAGVPTLGDDVPAISSAPASSSGGFDTKPRTVTGRVTRVDSKARKLFLRMPDGMLIEFSVPEPVPIYSLEGQPISFIQLNSSDTLRVFYDPLSVEAKAIRKV